MPVLNEIECKKCNKRTLHRFIPFDGSNKGNIYKCEICKNIINIDDNCVKRNKK